METLTIPMLVNSTIVPFILVRWNALLTSKGGRLHLFVFISLVFSVNATLLSDEFELHDALYRAFMISVGVVVMLFVLAYVQRNSDDTVSRH